MDWYWLLLLVGVVLLLGLAWWRHSSWTPLSTAIERRLGGYRHHVNTIDRTRPRACEGPPPHVAVVGAGLGGIGAAAAIAERGIPVTLYERNGYLGGKVGAWTVPVEDSTQTVDHGFHAFFRQYYNLNRFLDRLGVLDGFRAIEDYLILDGNGRPLSFGEVETVPALNIVDLARKGFYRWRDVLPHATRSRLQAFLRFDMEQTYATLDNTSFERFCDEAALPPALRVSFRTFARAFFSDEADLSTADVLRAFHFYYLSHDHGLVYDYPAGDYESALLSPIRAHLETNRVDVRLDTSVEELAIGSERRFRIGDDEYDWVIAAADIPGLQRMLEASAWIADAHPGFVAQMRALRTSHGYAIWRLWIDRPIRDGLPTFVNVERRHVLDSVTLYHRVTGEARHWATRQGGAVIELHCYALPPKIPEPEIRRCFLEELAHYFPELSGLRVIADSLQVRYDFPSFAPGQRALRPSTQTPIEGLLMAGDWVRLPYPMTHMEAAFTSGLLAANTLFDRLGLQEEPVFSVAPRGLLAPQVRSASPKQVDLAAARQRASW